VNFPFIGSNIPAAPAYGVYISQMIRYSRACGSYNVSSDSRKWLIKHLFPPSSCKKLINKQNSYLLLAFFQSGSVPELEQINSLLIKDNLPETSAFLCYSGFVPKLV
jgi:hypothetical protein